MTSSELRSWLDTVDIDLVSLISRDIKRHVNYLRSSSESFYGYAVLPGDYCTQSDPATITVAYNKESDLMAENSDDPYYRYSVDEWQNYVHEGFDATLQNLQSSLKRFKAAHSRTPNSFVIDEYEEAFIAKTNQAILIAMLALRKEGVFDEDTYLVIWYSDSGCDIVNQSAKTLNTTEIYEQFALEFE